MQIRKLLELLENKMMQDRAINIRACNFKNIDSVQESENIANENHAGGRD